MNREKGILRGSFFDVEKPYFAYPVRSAPVSATKGTLSFTACSMVSTSSQVAF